MVNYVGDREGKNFLVRDNMKGRWRGESSVFRTCSNSIAVIFSGRKCQKVSRGRHIMSSPMLCVTELGFTLCM